MPSAVLNYAACLHIDASASGSCICNFHFYKCQGCQSYSIRRARGILPEFPLAAPVTVQRWIEWHLQCGIKACTRITRFVESHRASISKWIAKYNPLFSWLLIVNWVCRNFPTKIWRCLCRIWCTLLGKTGYQQNRCAPWCCHMVTSDFCCTQNYTCAVSSAF